MSHYEKKTTLYQSFNLSLGGINCTGFDGIIVDIECL